MASLFRPFKPTKSFDTLANRLERMENSQKCGGGYIPDGSKCHSGETKPAPKAKKRFDFVGKMKGNIKKMGSEPKKPKGNFMTTPHEDPKVDALRLAAVKAQGRETYAQKKHDAGDRTNVSLDALEKIEDESEAAFDKYNAAHRAHGPKGGPPEFESREQKGDFYRAKMAAQKAAAHGGYDGKKPVPPPTSDPKGGAPEFVSREHKAAFYREKMEAQKATAPPKPAKQSARDRWTSRQQKPASDYGERVSKLEAEGMTTSDAQSVIEAEDMHSPKR